MSRIAATFARLQEQGRKALIPFITAGDPEPGITVPTMHAMVEAGASILELGVPFSDPMADGPVIQHASERALKHHVGLRDVLAMVKQFRHQDSQTPVVLMGYLNPIEVMGYEAFASAALEAGVDGVLTVDMPPEEGSELAAALRSHDIDTIFLLAPTTGEARIQRICDQASGFVYYVSVKGITGSASLDTDEVARRLDLIRSKTSLPVGVGFGIKDGASAARVAKMADAVIVGSALVSRFEALQHESDKIPAQAAAFISELRTAMDE
ncbi:MAG: tryptophan synthase subunit alpha [Chromatiales bacterium]|nr:tryptophan synthase subunit alpha [Gammaproteobacteria bacterium]MBW6476011.1 tryptophan synthase subunit alpha [Chromatiales bacterium]